MVSFCCPCSMCFWYTPCDLDNSWCLWQVSCKICFRFPLHNLFHCALCRWTTMTWVLSYIFFCPDCTWWPISDTCGFNLSYVWRGRFKEAPYGWTQHSGLGITDMGGYWNKVHFHSSYTMIMLSLSCSKIIAWYTWCVCCPNSFSTSWRWLLFCLFFPQHLCSVPLCHTFCNCRETYLSVAVVLDLQWDKTILIYRRCCRSSWRLLSFLTWWQLTF